MTRYVRKVAVAGSVRSASTQPAQSELTKMLALATCGLAGQVLPSTVALALAKN